MKIYMLFGDAVEINNYITKQKDFIPLAGPANKEARVVANNICKIDTKYIGTQGSSILKLFDMTIAMTGINEQKAKQENIDYEKIFVMPYSHATYYPGAKSMILKVIYEKQTTKILGAQIIGYAGVDKRCDIIATAIRANMTAYDLSDLELCYAPPFSSAKDPVNIAGNVIVNTNENLIKNIYIEDLTIDDKNLIVDVRTKKEYETGNIKNSIHIPLNDLRANLEKLDKNKKIIVYCHSGLRSYIACRILSQNGYDVYNLVGGYTLYDSIKKMIQKGE